MPTTASPSDKSKWLLCWSYANSFNTPPSPGVFTLTWLRLYRVRYPPLWVKPKSPCCLKCAHICLFGWCACAPIHNWIHNLLKKIAICDLLFICVAGIGLPAQKKKKKKKKKCPLGFDLADFRQKVPWERSRVAFSEVIFGENIGRTDKLSRSC